MENKDLTIVGFEASSRDDANDLADAIDALAADGTVTVHELAVAHKNAHGRVKVHYITDHGAGIGAAVGAGWGALGLGSGTKKLKGPWPPNRVKIVRSTSIL